MAQKPLWLIYEQCISVLLAEKHENEDISVTPNARIIGKISGTKRQIDLLIDSRWHNTEQRIIVDAKQRKRKVDITDVENVEGLMRDCQATRAIIICTNGYTEAAFKRAQEAITISIFELSDIASYNWTHDPCFHCNSNLDQFRGIVLWSQAFGFQNENGLLSILQIGKCDNCHTFHVWCWDCGLQFEIPDTCTVQCRCKDRKWASVPEVSEHPEEGEPESVWLMLIQGNLIRLIDRRPLI